MTAGAFVLIMFMATSSSTQSGAAAISHEFDSEQACVSAGKALAGNAVDRKNYVITWGCFSKGGAK